MVEKHHRSMWRSRTGFLLAVIGSAVGLGNIWRFPYVAYRNGGGAFFIPYFIALFLVGIPLMVLEQGLGHMNKGSAPLAIARIRRKWEYLGWWPSVFVMFGLMLYYGVILSWCLNYFVLAIEGSWGLDTETFFFKTFLGASSSAFDIGGIRPHILTGLAAIWFVNWIIIYRGIRRGIELANKIGMPLLLGSLIILLVWSLFLPGSSDGIAAYLTPDISKLTSPAVWMDAFGQIFFSLSLGSGCMIVFASYLPRKANINGNSLITASTNSMVEIMAGFAVFSVIGYMAVSVGEPVAKAVAGGPGLAFVVYPQAISRLPYGNEVFGTLFFLSLVIAGVTSSIAMLETFVSAVIDKFGWHRKKVVTASCLIGLLGGIIFTTGAGIIWLDIIDHFVSHVGMLIVGLLETILVAYIFGSAKFSERTDRISTVKFGRYWIFCARYFIPVVLAVLFIADFIKSIENPYGGYPWSAIVVVGVGWLLATLVVAAYFTKRKWLTGHLEHKHLLPEEEELLVEMTVD